MDVRVGDGSALVEGDHVLLGQRISGLAATSGAGAALQGPDDGARRRLLVVVEVVLGELDQLEPLLLNVLAVGLGVLIGGLLMRLKSKKNLTIISR